MTVHERNHERGYSRYREAARKNFPLRFQGGKGITDITFITFMLATPSIIRKVPLVQPSVGYHHTSPRHLPTLGQTTRPRLWPVGNTPVRPASWHKPFATTSTRAITVAEKDRSIDTPRVTGLPLVLPGRSRAYYYKEPKSPMQLPPGMSRSHLLLTWGCGAAHPLRSREGHAYGSEQCPTSLVES
jgi:hypothetical protein